MFALIPRSGYYSGASLGVRSVALLHAVKASGRLLNCYRKRIDLLNYTVLTKDERLVVTTMLFNNTTMRYLQSLVDLGF